MLIIVAGVISSLFRALTPWASQYKTEVEQHLSALIGEPVTIGRMETGWYWFEPVIKLNQVSVSDGKQEVAKLSKLLVGINLFSSLWHWQIQPGVLFIDDLHLNIRQNQDRWQIDGVSAYGKQTLDFEQASYSPVLAWILAQQKIVIKNLSAYIYLQDKTLIPLNDLNLSVIRRGKVHRIKGTGHLEQTTATDFQLFAEISLDPYALNEATGHAFFAVNHFLPAQWQGFFPQSRFELINGKGGARLWVDIAKGQISNVQSQLHFRHFAWLDKESGKNQLLQSVKANVAWNPTRDGWQLAADKVQLRLGNTRWPANSFLIRYENTKQDYYVFIQNLLLNSLFSAALPWPAAMQEILAMQPHGDLQELQFHIRKQKPTSILTRFVNLGWQFPQTGLGFDGLSGVFHWKPEEGRLEFDSEKTVMSLKDQKPINWDSVNAALAWHKQEQGWQIIMEHLSLSHPNLLLNAEGALDGVSEDTKGNLQLKADFYAKDAQKWLRYLPEKHLKPKLYAWLKQDIKRIDTLGGQLLVKGPIADFPFDKQPGEFSIKSHLGGVDLIFAPNWPLTRDIAAALNFNKRTLEADISHANLNGIIVDNGHLLVRDLGLDRETLLIHSKVEAGSEQALAYVMSSPLSKKLSSLNMLRMQGFLDLDLQLEAPLYPENDEILALGDVNFKNNLIQVHHSLDDIELEQLNGGLQFDQEGVLDSNLKAKILGHPVSLFIRSIQDSNPYTEIKLKGKTSTEVLAKKFKLPFLSLMHGTLWLESLLILTDEPGDLDHLAIKTSLHGVNIDLPPPLGKLAQAKTPLTVDIDFNPEKAVRLRFNYDNRLSSDLWFSGPAGAFGLEKGQLRLGSGKAVWQGRQQGLQIVGSLSSFDLQQWLRVSDKLPETTDKKGLLDRVNFVDVKVENAKLWSRSLKNLALKAVKQAKGDWSIRLNQSSLSANLLYQPETNTLTGQFDKLDLASSDASQKLMNFSAFNVKPGELPNLDLRVASLRFGALDLGELSLKTRSSNAHWQLEQCKITTPFYQLSAKGEWLQQGKQNTTQLRADMHITNLAKSLESWKISPVVEAKQGELRFQGGWSGALTDFSLAKLKGMIAMRFKNGRITNLSPETEEKLGLGKLLSILSLQTIPRRLKLDFSDLSKDGYSFDEFNGSFSLAKGILTTKNSYIDGPVAYASMKGQLDLAKQSYDVDLKISPHITASLPIVATIAGGPVAGFITWVASKIINQGMQTISGYTYKISGPWQQPVVQQVSIIKKQQVVSRP